MVEVALVFLLTLFGVSILNVLFDHWAGTTVTNVIIVCACFAALGTAFFERKRNATR